MRSRAPDLRELIGDAGTPEQLERLRRVDALLRTLPAPPPMTASLDPAFPTVVSPPRRRRLRLAGAFALAAAASALLFGLGHWEARDALDTQLVVRMHPAAAARGSSAVIRLGKADGESGNRALELEVSGLATLPAGDHYVLWLVGKRGHRTEPCGTFSVAARGATTVRMNISYRLPDYDAWVVTRDLPAGPPDLVPPALLAARVAA